MSIIIIIIIIIIMDTILISGRDIYSSTAFLLKTLKFKQFAEAPYLNWRLNNISGIISISATCFRCLCTYDSIFIAINSTAASIFHAVALLRYILKKIITPC